MLFEAIVFLVINIHCSKATRKYQFDKRYAKVLMALFAGTLKRRFQKSLQLFEKRKKREKINRFVDNIINPPVLRKNSTPKSKSFQKQISMRFSGCFK